MSGIGSVGGSPSFFDEAGEELHSAEGSVEAVASRMASSARNEVHAAEYMAGNMLQSALADKAPATAAPAPAPVTTSAPAPAAGATPPLDPAKVQAQVTALQRIMLNPPGVHLLGVNVLNQTLAWIQACKPPAVLDAALGKVGRSKLIAFLSAHLIDTAVVQRAIDAARATGAKPGDWAGFDTYLDQVTGTQARAGNKVTLLDNGTTAFPAIFKAIDSAKSSVNVETYEFHDDATGQEYAQHLIDAARRGVKVSLMMDEHGSKPYGGDEMAAKMRAAGIQVIQSPTDLLADKIDHRKVCVVDGQTGFTGGMNIGDDYNLNWHDMHAEVQGPAVADLQKAFQTRWTSEGGTIPSGVNYFPPIATQPDNQTVRVIPHVGGKDENIRMAYLRGIDTAQKTICIEDPYFVDTEVLAHLKAAAQRGVDVRCVWPAQNDMAIEKTAAHRAIPDLLAAGVKCYEYQPSMAHEKVCTIDGRFATIGSSNLDARSLENNNELNLAVTDPKFAGELQSTILQDIDQHSTQITSAPPETLKEKIEDVALAHPIFEDEI